LIEVSPEAKKIYLLKVFDFGHVDCPPYLECTPPPPLSEDKSRWNILVGGFA